MALAEVKKYTNFPYPKLEGFLYTDLINGKNVDGEFINPAFSPTGGYPLAISQGWDVEQSNKYVDPSAQYKPIEGDAISTQPPEKIDDPALVPDPVPPTYTDWPLPTELQRCEFTDQFGQTPIGEFGWNGRASQCPPDRVAYFEVPKDKKKVVLTPNPQGNDSEIEFCLSTTRGNFDPSNPSVYLKSGGLQEPYTLPNNDSWPFHPEATVFASVRFTKKANSVLVSRGS